MSATRSSRLVVGLLLSALLLASCGSKDPLSGSVVKDGVGCAPDQTDRKTDSPPTVEAVDGSIKKIKTTDITVGKGCAAQAGSYLAVDMLGATAADAKIFRSSWADGRPLTLQLGKNQLIEGLEVGLAGMKVGGRREIRIPAKQGYGKSGDATLGIGADEDLLVVADLVGATDTPLYCNQGGPLPAGKSAGKPTQVTMPVEAPQKLKTTDLEPGTGTRTAKKGDYVVVDYVGVSCATGEQFDSSWDNGEQFPVTLGQGTIEGFWQGLVGAKEGALRQIEIPSDLAYGAAGSAPKIGANDPLVFVIRVNSIDDKPPTTTTTAPATTTTGG